MEQYSLQYNEDGSVTVFDEEHQWVGVFRKYAHAIRFVRRVLEGEIVE